MPRSGAPGASVRVWGVGISGRPLNVNYRSPERSAAPLYVVSSHLRADPCHDSLPWRASSAASDTPTEQVSILLNSSLRERASGKRASSPGWRALSTIYRRLFCGPDGYTPNAGGGLSHPARRIRERSIPLRHFRGTPLVAWIAAWAGSASDAAMTRFGRLLAPSHGLSGWSSETQRAPRQIMHSVSTISLSARHRLPPMMPKKMCRSPFSINAGMMVSNGRLPTASTFGCFERGSKTPTGYENKKPSTHSPAL